MKRILVLLATFVLAFGLPGAAVSAPKEKAPAASRNDGPGGPDGASALVRVGDRQVTRDQFREMLGKEFFTRHGMAVDAPGGVVTGAVEQLVRDMLVASEVDELSKTDPGYRSLRVYLEDAIVGSNYRKKVLPGVVRVTAEEVAAQAPKYSREIRIRQLTVASGEEAERIRERLAAGNDFIPLIRERSIDPGASNDGLHVGFLREGDTRFSREDLKHLFSLEKGQYSRVLPTPYGFSICRVEEVMEIPDSERDRKMARVREAIVAQRLREMTDAVRKEIVTAELDREPFSRSCQLYLEGDSGKGRSIVFATVDRELTLESVVFVVDQAAAATSPGGEADNAARKSRRYYERALPMTDLVVSAFIARKAGYEMPAGDRARLDLFVDQQMSAFHYQRAFGSIAASDGEAREYYLGNPEPFIGGGSVDLYDIHFGSKVAADRAKKRLAGGEKFEDVARKSSIDKESGKKGGHVGVKPLASLLPEVAAAVRTLGEGQSSDPIQTRDGFHIVKVARRIPAEMVPFEENRKKFRQVYLEIKRKKAVEEYLQSLRGKYPVEVDWEGVRGIIQEKEKEKGKKKT